MNARAPPRSRGAPRLTRCLSAGRDLGAPGIRWGHFCSKRLIDSLGLAAQDGVIRVSLVHYNTVEEVDRFVAVLRAILASPAADAPTEPAKGGYGL